MGSGYYENFRATKFNNPPCLYNVISTSLSNEAITLKTFPVLVWKQTETPMSGGPPCPSVVRTAVPYARPLPPTFCPGNLSCSPTTRDAHPGPRSYRDSVIPDSKGSHELA